MLIGDTVPALFAIADASSSPTNSGLIATSDLMARTCVPVSNPFFFNGKGFGGLAYDDANQLWATTSNGNGSTSQLVRLQLTSSAVLTSVDVTLAGQPISIGDLTFDLQSRTLIGIRSAQDGLGGAGSLYVIDRTSGQATLIGNTGLNQGGGLGFGASGQLFVTSFNSQTNVASLHTLDRTTAAVTSTLALSNPLGRLGEVVGLSSVTADGLFIASDVRSNEITTINPVTGERAIIDLVGAPIGVAGDIAIQPSLANTTTVYYQDFEAGVGGFTTDNTGGTIPGLWHLSVGRRDDQLINHTPVQSFYYGAFETAVGRGDYLRPFDHQGVLISPQIAIPATGSSTLSFNYLLETRPQLNNDIVDVSIDNGTTVTKIFSRQDGSLPQTGRLKWLTAISDLSAFAGQSIQIRFSFDTGDTPNVDPEGWYVDDIRITNTIAPLQPPPPPLSSVDLFVEKSVDDSTPNVGQTIRYTITATNRSTSTATGVTVTDVLPAGVTFVSADPMPISFDPVTRTVSWPAVSMGGSLSVDFTVVATVNADTAGQPLENTAMVIGDQVDPDPSNNTVMQTSIVNSVDLQVNKSADNLQPFVGDTVTFTILVSNSLGSNNSATNVTVTDVLPNGLEYVSSMFSEGNFDPITGIWTLPNLPKGEMQELKLIAKVKPNTGGTIIVNQASVSGSETDPVTNNDRSSVTLTVSQTVQFIAPLSVFRPGQFVLPSTDRTPILGRLWFDENADGIWQATEQGLDGVNVELLQPQTSGGALSLGFAMSRAVDFNGDGLIDDFSERGIYWFGPETQIALGTYTLRLALPAGVGTSFPVAAVEQTISITAVQPLIQGGAFQAVPPNFGVTQDFIATPAAGNATIIGHSWADLDLDGMWDDVESGRDGFQFFLDQSNDGIFDGVFDPEIEPSALTGADGKYVFANVAPGTYVIREVNTRLAPVRQQTVPQSPGYTVTVTAGQKLEGSFRRSQEPNFGVFEYGEFVRPADEFIKRDSAELLSSLEKWQTFEITNNTDADFNIDQIDFGGILGKGKDFVTVRQIVGTSTIEPASSIVVSKGITIQFLVFYDPAIRSKDSSEQVIEQSPDWLGSPTSTQKQVHTFANTDKLIIRTSNGMLFNVELIGGSTFDSDITHDGTVDADDLRVLNLLILNEPTIVDGESTRFDPTADINVRCPNGAGQVVATCVYLVDGAPAREISLGDFGPLNVEWNAKRDSLTVSTR